MVGSMMRTFADVARPGRDSAGGQLPLALQTARTVTTPEFAGMTFLEVETRSALNKVSGMPFAWSINPYRGCSHACSYCMVGDTPVLMADGRTRPLADLRSGDEIYGTRRQGHYRRFVRTRVLDHWSVTKPAYRVRLEDGTQLVTSGDHRFLTNRGWKHVTGAEHGHDRRPHLTVSNRLLGLGGFPDAPKKEGEYRRGYLTGMIRGDGSLGSYTYRREGRTHGDVQRFRLALADTEGLDRAQQYLAREGVPTDRFLFAVASSQRRQIHAIRTQQRAAVQRVREIIAWPVGMSEQWCRGFLAGVFDAEGSWSGVVRIVNNDGQMLDVTDQCFRRLGLSTVVEPPRLSGCSAVRLTGGVWAVVRFFQLVDPAITRKRSIEGMAVKTKAPTRVVEISDLGLELPLYDITTGTGDFIANGVVSHNCFARPTHRYLELSPGADFERKIVVKTNVVEVLRAELARPRWRGEKVALGTNTDPYQRCEGRYALMPGIIRALADGRTPLSILTKGTLINRDRALLADAAREVEVTAAFTVGMLDDDTWRASEPGTPHPRARLDAVRALNDAGVPTGVMLAPIMPGINDDHEQLAALIDRAAAAGATHITAIVLHLRRGVREVFWPWLEQAYPELVARYAALYRGSQAPREYRDGVQRFVTQRRREAYRRHGPPAHATRPRFGSPPRSDSAERVSRAHAVEQLRLL